MENTERERCCHSTSRASICLLYLFPFGLLYSLYKGMPLTWQNIVWLASNERGIYHMVSHAQLSSLLH